MENWADLGCLSDLADNVQVPDIAIKHVYSNFSALNQEFPIDCLMESGINIPSNCNFCNHIETQDHVLSYYLVAISIWGHFGALVGILNYSILPIHNKLVLFIPKVKVPMAVTWKPSLGGLKLNIYVSSLGNPSLFSCGGVCQDGNASFVFGFAQSLGTMTNFKGLSQWTPSWVANVQQ
ncbi:hypothetical protein ACH5RR_025924 [Cinchona calisaya]|uniref:Uncharacterized protein n=1 Tax=Cinchona calisaya TaxID=153742 RepID=A0ABD2Z127_9GENT